MKKILFVLCLGFFIVGCGGERISEKRILIDELINKSTYKSPIMYFENGLFTCFSFSKKLEGNENWYFPLDSDRPSF